MARARQPRCPECRALLPRGREDGPCPKCDWEAEYEDDYEEEYEEPVRTRARAGRGGRRAPARSAGQGMSPVVLGLLVGGGAAALILILLVAMGGGSGGGETPAPKPTPTAEGPKKPDKPKEPVKLAPSPKETWPERYKLTMARLEPKKSITESVGRELDELRRDAVRYGTEEQKTAILDLWVRLDPDNEELRDMRGDVLYTGPFRRQVGGKWKWPVNPKSGEKTKIWISKAESEALEKDEVYQAAVRAVETARQMDGVQKGAKAYHTFFFFDDDVVPRPFFVASQSKTPSFAKDRAASTVETLVALRRATLGMYDEIMNKINGDREFLIPMYVFGGPTVYNEFRKRSTIKGMPDPAVAAGFFTYNPKLNPIGWLFVWARNPKAAHFLDVIAHEGTHLLQWQYGKSNTPRNRTNPGIRTEGSTCWFQEGLAEYWGGFVLKQHKGETVFLPGRVQGGRLDHLMQFLPRKGKPIPTKMPSGRAGYMPLRQMCRRSYADYHAEFSYRANRGDPVASQMVGMFYAQGWAFVHFLKHYKNGVYRKALRRYMITELKCDFKWHQLEKDLGVSGAKGWRRLDKQFVDYVHDVLWKDYTKGGSTAMGAWADTALKDLAAAIEKRETRLKKKKK